MFRRVIGTPDRASCRELIVGVFKLAELARFWEDRCQKGPMERFDVIFDVKGPFLDVVDDVLGWCDREGRLELLLAQLLRAFGHLATHADRLAEMLGVAELLALADVLVAHGCSPDAFAAALELPVRQRWSPIATATLRAQWIDRLVWIDDFPAAPGQAPPLIQVVAQVAAQQPAPAATALRGWIDGHRGRFQGEIARVAALAPTGIAVEVDTDTGAVIVWEVAGDGAAHQVDACTISVVDRRTVIDELGRFVDGLVRRGLARTASGAPMRVYFLLPAAYLDLEVDRLPIGDEEDTEPLGVFHEVVVARSKVYRNPGGAGQIIMNKRQSPRMDVGLVTQPQDWQSHCRLTRVTESAGYHFTFDDIELSGSVVRACLKEPVLMVLWPRSDSAQIEHAPLTSGTFARIPAAVLGARQKAGVRLALVWHHDPIRLPTAANPLSPPTRV